jgi:hypothetical protein
MLSGKQGPNHMPFRKRERAEHALQEQHFKDIERSLRDAKDLLVVSKQEIERSRRIMDATDPARREPTAKGRIDADRT